AKEVAVAPPKPSDDDKAIEQAKQKLEEERKAYEAQKDSWRSKKEKNWLKWTKKRLLWKHKLSLEMYLPKKPKIYRQK
ncbi:MAG: hypothetical protein ACOVQA_04405, partial [Thermoflexibacteraceae bacterium]